MPTIETRPRPTYVYDGATDTWYPIGGVSYANIRTYEYLATASQTTFSGADLNGVQLDYTPNSIIVSLNGVTLAPGDDYTATTGNTIVLTSAAAVNDLLMITAFSTFNIADAYTKAEVDARSLRGGGTDKIFLENDQTVSANYTVSANKNAMSTGPIAINTGITVTIPSGSVWRII